jgi:hypothetical protein
MMRYIRRVQAARREEQAAQTALDYDYQDRIENNGPWGEDETYLRLNDNAAHASAHLLAVVLRRSVDDNILYAPVCAEGVPAYVGMLLRNLTGTERGAELADRWDQAHGVDTRDGLEP